MGGTPSLNFLRMGLVLTRSRAKLSFTLTLRCVHRSCLNASTRSRGSCEWYEMPPGTNNFPGASPSLPDTRAPSALQINEKLVDSRSAQLRRFILVPRLARDARVKAAPRQREAAAALPHRLAAKLHAEMEEQVICTRKHVLGSPLLQGCPFPLSR